MDADCKLRKSKRVEIYGENTGFMIGTIIAGWYFLSFFCNLANESFQNIAKNNHFLL